MKALRTILAAWLALLVLLGMTIAASFAPLGPALPFVSYGIAFAKAAIIVWLFMELRTRDGIQRIALAAGFVFTAIMFILMFSDPLTRGWPP